MELKLSKLKVKLEGQKPLYYWNHLEEQAVNELIGKKLSIRFSGKITCVNCDREMKKSFQNGYCYPCFQTLAECDLCIMKPELCHFDKGTCRDEDFAKKHCFIPHVIYLADSSSLKVGITRAYQKTTRWVDQGATKAVAIREVSSRKEAGEVEVFLKDYMSDKTNWRNMLKGLQAEEDLEFKKDEILELCDDADLPGEALYDEEITEIEFPVDKYPEKIKSFNLEKQDLVEGELQGVKGQYLIFDTGVFNVRKHSGFHVSIVVS